MNQQSRDYWVKRQEQLQNSLLKPSEQYCEEMANIYAEAMRDIEKDIAVWYQRFADNNGVTDMAEARRLLNAGELKELKWDVNQYIKAGKENGISADWSKELENASAKVHISRLEALKLQTTEKIEELYGGRTDKVDSLLKDIYTEGYYKNAYELAKGTGIGQTFSRIDENKLDNLVGKPWTVDGVNFSDRIWQSKEKLINTVQNELTKGAITGATPKELTDKIAKEMAAGVTAPPFHPNCRCTTIPYFEDEFTEGEKRIARDEDGNTVYVDGDMKYDEWREKFVDNEVNERGITKKSGEGIVSNKVNLKYINSEEYKTKFNKITDNSDVNKAIYKYSKAILNHRNDSNFEDLYLIDTINGKFVSKQTSSKVELGIVYGDEIKKVIEESEKYSLISIHNHPTENPPTGSDYASNGKNKYNFGVVVTHSGKVYKYRSGNKPFRSKYFDSVVDKYKRQGYTEVEAILKTTDRFSVEFGIEMEELL